jgi:hypothetical protein
MEETMRTARIAIGLGALWAGIMSASMKLNAADPAAAGAAGGPAPGNLRISAPVVHDNLTVFLLHGQGGLDGRKFLTLQEALDKKVVVVHETGNVGELAVENSSKEFDVYIMAGDIVKGGRQDRVLQYDFIVPPVSGKMPIASFCVESGRWSARGQEAAGRFSSANNCLSDKNLKLAARAAGQQGEVWKKVAESQGKLSDNLGADVKARQSASSLQLTLENEKLKQTTAAYLKTFAGLTAGKGDVIGYAFAVNGKVNSVEIFGSAELFAKLWPKLAEAACIEAIAELKKDLKFSPVAAEDVRRCMAEAEKGKAAEREVTRRLREIRQENEKAVLFDTRDRDNNNASLRKSYLAK